MRPGKVLTEELRRKIEDLAASMQNPTAGKIANKLGLKQGTVYWFMLCNGLVKRKPARYCNKPYVRNGLTINPYSAEEDALLLEMRTAGHSFTAIAKALTERCGTPRNVHSVRNRTIMLAAVDDESEAA